MCPFFSQERSWYEQQRDPHPSIHQCLRVIVSALQPAWSGQSKNAEQPLFPRPCYPLPLYARRANLSLRRRVSVYGHQVVVLRAFAMWREISEQKCQAMERSAVSCLCWAIGGTADEIWKHQDVRKVVQYFTQYSTTLIHSALTALNITIVEHKVQFLLDYNHA